MVSVMTRSSPLGASEVFGFLSIAGSAHGSQAARMAISRFPLHRDVPTRFHDQLVHRLRIGGLRQVMIEARSERAAAILLLAPTRKGYQFRRRCVAAAQRAR